MPIWLLVSLRVLLGLGVFVGAMWLYMAYPDGLFRSGILVFARVWSRRSSWGAQS